MPHFFNLVPRLRPLFAMLAVCGLLTGFAAQVPSPPPLPAAPSAAATAPANPPAAPPALVVDAPVPETTAPGTPVAQPHFPSAAALPSAPPPAPLSAPEGPALDPAAIREHVAVLDHLEYFLDPSFTLTTRDIIESTRPFSPWQAPLPRETGAIWLRLRLAPMPSGLPEQVFLHLGPAVADTPSVWMIRPGSLDPVTIRPEDAGVYPILYSQAGGTLLARIETWPAAGFAPWVGRLDNDAETTASMARYAALILLGLAAMACLLRGLIERREWRIWAGLFALAALIQGIWSVPALPGGRLNPWDAPAIIAPALALFILPHAGRHLMATRQTMPRLDTLFVAVSLIGLIVGLLPLAPGQMWMARWLPLWPLGIMATILVTLPAVRKGLAGCGRYLLACLPAALGAAPLLTPLVLRQPQLAAWNCLVPLGGLACSALILSLVGGRPEPRAAVRRPGSRQTAGYDEHALDLQLDPPEPDDGSSAPPPGGLELPMFKRDKRRDPIAPLLKSNPAALATTRVAANAAPCPGASRPQAMLRAEPDPETLVNLEETLRVPLDALLRQSIALDMQPLPDSARPHVRELVASGRAITGIISNLSRVGLPLPPRLTVENAVIDLPRLLRDAHAAVAEQAEDRNLAVSWYAAPHLGRRYAGPADRLASLLRLLMENAVRGTDQGSVQIWARRDPDSNDPGHLVFTVADTGSGMPPLRRNALLPAHAWELAGELGGSVRLDSGPTGTSISFSVALKALPAHAAAPDAVIADPDAPAAETEDLLLPSLRIILADNVSSRRQLLAYMLEGLPHDLFEARTVVEAVALHADVPARLIVFDGSMPEQELIDAVAAIRSLDGERDLPPASLLALTGNEIQGTRLRRAGMDHILYQPVSRSVLRQAALHLAPVPGMALPPLPHTPAPAAPRPPEPQSPTPQKAPAPDPVAAAAPATQPGPKAATPGQPEAATPGQPKAATPVQAAPGLTANPPRQSTPMDSPDLNAPGPDTESATALDDLPLPAYSAKAAQDRRKPGLLDRLLGVLPRRRTSLPDLETAPEPDRTSRPKSRSVGEPRPMPRGERRPEAETAARTARKDRVAYTPPRLATPSDDSLLSENGVGEPMPIVRRKAPELPAFVHLPDPDDERFSENGVGEPMPIVRTQTPDPAEPDPAGREPLSRPLPSTPGFPPLPSLEPPVFRHRASLLDLIQSVGPDPFDEAVPEDPAPVPDIGLRTVPVAAAARQREDAGDAVVLELLHTLDDALLRVEAALARNDADSVRTATGQMADHAERFGLHVLARMTRGMQDMAAEPDGLDAVTDTMPDLRATVERNRISFTMR